MSNKGRKSNINAKSITMPLAAFSMACILFVYARTSIHAAKLNAQKHREADGGQISWRNENLRRHGVLEAPEAGKGTVGELVGSLKDKGVGVGGAGSGEGSRSAIGPEEERVREARADAVKRGRGG